MQIMVLEKSDAECYTLDMGGMHMAKKKKHSYRKKHIQTRSITISVLAPIIGGISLLFFGVMTIICAVQKEWGTLTGFGIFDLLGLALILTVNWRIDYNHQGFTYWNYFRVSRSYTYDQITAIHQSKDTIIRIGHKRILIDQMADNGEKFISVAMQYAHSARYTTAGESRLFRGNIEAPGEFIFIWGIVGVFGIIALIAAAIFFPPLTLGELETVDVTVSGLEEQYDENDIPLLKLI